MLCVTSQLLTFVSDLGLQEEGQKYFRPSTYFVLGMVTAAMSISIPVLITAIYSMCRGRRNIIRDYYNWISVWITRSA